MSLAVLQRARPRESLAVPRAAQRQQLTQGSLTDSSASMLIRLVAWARARSTAANAKLANDSRASRLMSAAPDRWPVLFVLPSEQSILVACGRSKTLGSLLQLVIETRDRGQMRDPNSPSVLMASHVPLYADRDGSTHFPIEKDEVLGDVPSIARERLAGITPRIVLRRVPHEEPDVDAKTTEIVNRLVGGKLSWKDANTGRDANEDEIQSFRQSMALLRFIEYKRKMAPVKASSSAAGGGPTASDAKLIVAVSLPLNQATSNVIAAPGETASGFLERMFNKFYVKNPKLASRSWQEFALKVTGFSEYIDGPTLLAGHAYIRQCVRRDERPKLTLVPRQGIADLTPERPIRARAQDYSELWVDGGFQYEAYDVSVGARAFDTMTCISLWDLHRDFRIRVVGVENLGRQGTSFWATERTRRVLDPKGGAATAVEWNLHVTIGMYHGGHVLGSVMKTSRIGKSDTPRWQEWLTMQYKMSNIPACSRLCCTVWASSADMTPIPLGWVNVPLFDFKSQLQQGLVSLSLWPDAEANPIGTCVANLTPGVPALVLEFETYAKPVVIPTHNYREELPAPEPISNPDVASRLFLDAASWDPLYKMSPDEKKLLWRYRELVHGNLGALPRVLLSVQSWNRVAVQQSHEMLKKCSAMEPAGAMELLDSSFADPRVRSYAVKCLERYDDEELCAVLLQLVQALKYELYHNSSLARFLLRRAFRARKVGHLLFWYLKSEMHVQEISQRYGLLIEAYLKGCGQHKVQLVDQDNLLTALTKTANLIKVRKDSERLEILRNDLRQIKWTGPIKLPLDPRVEVKGLRIDKCKYMDSKKLPLWLVFENADPEGRDVYVIFKAGDDLRQDMLTLQMLRLMETLWRSEGPLDLRMNPYHAIATGDEVGMIEVVLNSETTASITRKAGGAKAAFKADPLYNWLAAQDCAPMDVVVDTFARSCAGYCVATYCLGIGDRHNDNVMLTRSGALFHIDFGHFLGNVKSKFGIKRERSPFVFTPDFAYILGGKDSDEFKRFVALACKAYNVLRRNTNLFITLFHMMLSTGIPELQSVDDLDYLTEAFSPALTDNEAEAKMTKLIQEALNSKATQLNNWVHIMAHQ